MEKEAGKEVKTEKVAQKVVKCPVRPEWLKAMAEVLPPDLYGKLEPIIKECIEKRG